MKALTAGWLLGMISAQQGGSGCPSNPICPELTKEKATVTRGDENLTITCKVPRNFNLQDEPIILGYDTLGSAVKNEREMSFHRIEETDYGNFTFSGKAMTDRVDNASIYVGSVSSGCKIGEVRVQNLKNVQFHEFDSKGSDYDIHKDHKELQIWLQLNRQLTDDNYERYKTTMEHWKDHFMIKLSNTNDKKFEYYFTQTYKDFYCGDLYKNSEECEKGKIISPKVIVLEQAKELSYEFKIKDSKDRSPSMQFEMLFGPPYSHSSEFQFTETIIFYWPLWFYGLLVIFALILLSAGILCFVCVKKYTNKQIEKGINQAERKKLLSDDRPQEAFDHIMSCMPEKEKKILKKIYIDPTKIKRDGRELGKGAFGTTRAGTLQNDSGVTTHKIAIKTMKTAISNGINGPAYAAYTGGGYRGGSGPNSGTYPGSSSGEYFDGEHAKAIFDEAIQMSNFEHINVMKLIGVSFNRMAEPEMILPLMDCGDLRNYVKNDQNEILIRDCLRFCQQAAEGMNYLVRQGVIHRDLAARNCLLETTTNNRVNLRIADFGLSKTFENLYQEEYVAQSQTKLPLKWLAIEVLEQRMFSEKSDVWAFGVLTWEIFTRGAMPYGALSDWAGLKAYLLNGERLEMPADCAPELFELMMECWHDETEKRPTFANLVSRFDQFVKGHRESESKSGRKSSLPTRQNISFNREHFSRTKAGYKSNRGKKKMSPPVPAPRKPLPPVPDRGASLSPTHAEELV